jgi:HAD superfamily hydrolase (TIGR01509 family)
MRALLFDLDGVLVDSFAVWHSVLGAFAHERGYPEISDQAMEAGWGQGVDADARSFFPGTPVAALEAFYNDRFVDHLAQLRVMPDGAAVFAQLRAGGIPTAVITNTPAPLARALLARAEIGPDILVGGTDVPRPKPAADMVLRACELLSVSATEAAVVGDSEYDRRAAASAGALFIGFRCAGEQRIDRLGDLASLLGLPS